MLKPVIPPSNMSSSNTKTTANLYWQSGPISASWKIKWKASADFDPNISGQEDQLLVTSNRTNYQITGLTENAQHYIYYQAFCNAGSSSNWVGPFIVNTANVTESIAGPTIENTTGVEKIGN